MSRLIRKPYKTKFIDKKYKYYLYTMYSNYIVPWECIINNKNIFQFSTLSNNYITNFVSILYIKGKSK